MTGELNTPADASMLSANFSVAVEEKNLKANENVSSSQVSDNESADFESDEEQKDQGVNIWTHGFKW